MLQRQKGKGKASTSGANPVPPTVSYPAPVLGEEPYDVDDPFVSPKPQVPKDAARKTRTPENMPARKKKRRIGLEDASEKEIAFLRAFARRKMLDDLKASKKRRSSCTIPLEEATEEDIEG